MSTGDHSTSALSIASQAAQRVSSPPIDWGGVGDAWQRGAARACQTARILPRAAPMSRTRPATDLYFATMAVLAVELLTIMFTARLVVLLFAFATPSGALLGATLGATLGVGRLTTVWFKGVKRLWWKPVRLAAQVAKLGKIQ